MDTKNFFRLWPRLLFGFAGLTLFVPSSVQAIPAEFNSLFNRNIRYYNKQVEQCATGGNFSGENNRQIAFNFFRSKGLSAEQSAGVVGNLLVESAGTLDPKINQQGGGPGRGIAQWSVNERWQTLLNWAADQGKDPLTLETQLEFIWYELEGDPRNGLPELQASTTIEQATEVFMNKYERPGHPALEKRIQYAHEVFDAYSGSAPGSSGSSGCPIGPGVGGIDQFPLKTTKTQIMAGSGAVWCYNSTANCHHHYNAADLHVAPGVEVVAAKGGLVVRAADQVGGVGSRITILGGDGQYTYYYAHMEFGSLGAKEGDQVVTGQVIGRVGVSTQAEGTAPHVHFDMLPQAEFDRRPSCSNAECGQYPFVDVQPLLKQLYDTVVPD